MNPKPLNLSQEDRAELKWRGKYDENWRIRERVATILLLDTGLSCEKVALELNLSRGTVQTTKTGWMREKFDSLKDKARTGAPKKIKPQEEKMLLALAQESRCAQPSCYKFIWQMEASGFIRKRFAGCSKPIRCREKGQGTHSKKRDVAVFEQARLEIENLKRAAQAGEIEVAYLDEAGFSCIHPNRNAWTRKGQQHLIPAIRGQRLNVLAALMSSGYVEDCMFYGSMTGARLVSFIKEVAQKYDKPITLILDNASFHTSAVVKQANEEFEKWGGSH